MNESHGKKVPFYMIKTIKENIKALKEKVSLNNLPKEALMYYGISRVSLDYALTYPDPLSALLYLYEIAYLADDTVIEFTVHLYNKYFPNNPKYPHGAHFTRKEVKNEPF